MAKRRSDGEGAVFRYKNGWGGQLDVQEWNQPRRRKTVYGATETEVLSKIDSLRRQTQAGIAVPAGRPLTTGSYLEQWLIETLPGDVAAGRLKPSTLASYTDQTRRHIQPTLGSIPLVDLSPRHIRSWLTSKLGETSARGKPLAPRSVAYLHAILRNALAQAVRDELLPRNPAVLVRAPAQRPPTVVPLSVDEAQQLLAVTDRDRLSALWRVLLTLGLRRGEALALHWDDIDIDNQTITIRGSLQRLTSYDNLGKISTRLVETTPKTAGSAAQLPMPTQLTAALHAHRQTQLGNRLAASEWPRDDLVFTTQIGKPLEPRNVTRRFQQLSETANLRPLRLHDLRHSAASFLLLQGVDLKTVQTMLRHSRMATTADLYLHVHPQLQRDAGDRLEQLLTRTAAP
jgi:integrase